jgi:predicted XRE-type DNA-binding protein
MPQRARQRRTIQAPAISKTILAKEVARVLDERGLTQTAASYITKDAPSQLSLMAAGKVTGFSSERLIRTLARLGRDIDIVIGKARTGKNGAIRVTIK